MIYKYLCKINCSVAKIAKDQLLKMYKIYQNTEQVVSSLNREESPILKWIVRQVKSRMKPWN